MQEPFLSWLPSTGAGPILIPFSISFCSFSLPGYVEIFLTFHKSEVFCQLYNRYSENHSTCRFIFDVFVGEGKLPVYYSSSRWLPCMSFLEKSLVRFSVVC